MRSAALGRKGEGEAASWLESKGWTILERNFRTVRGEVDIVALDGDVLVFVEVKTWSTIGFSELGYSIDRRKIAKIVESAKIFLSRNREYTGGRVRFDVIFIGGGEVRHLAEAFTERV